MDKSLLFKNGRTVPLPIISFPSSQLLDVTVRELVCSSRLQAEGMKAVSERINSLAAVSFMDLSVEAECFGSKVLFRDNEIPTVIGELIDPDLDEDEKMDAAQDIKVPEVGSCRTAVCLEGIHYAKKLITDRPVFAGVIGPFSLTGRLLGVSNALVSVLAEEEMVHEILKKATVFITRYIKELKKAGADGVIMAEPLAGLLSPNLIEIFSCQYCQKIVEETKSEDFAFIYHNCGKTAELSVGLLEKIGADAYHFGNAADMRKVLDIANEKMICMGNIDPVLLLKGEGKVSIEEVVKELLENCGKNKNFILSTGCDVPPSADWEKIDRFFSVMEEYNMRRE